MNGSQGEEVRALVIGAGPAGLMAAQELSARGHGVVVAEARPSPARKFLMAGKSGLNITKDEPPAAFRAAYRAPWLDPVLAEFGPAQVMDWARGLGQEVFTGSSGRVFPTTMKGSPLLRAWLRRLETQGVEIRTRWRWTGWKDGGLAFDTPQGARLVTPRVTVLALGGASWSRLGSDGAWAPLLAAKGVALAPFRPANMGLAVDWSPYMLGHLGKPVKGVRLIAGPLSSRGEFVISRRGLEGGGIYAVASAVRDGAPLYIDFLPDVALDDLALRLTAGRKGETAARRLRRLGLAPQAAALLQEMAHPLPADPTALAGLLKALPVRHAGPRPMDEAISTAGGIMAQALTPSLMLRTLPGIFAAGEMLDWEAPTGGYLLTGCLATGRHAGRAAADYLAG